MGILSHSQHSRRTVTFFATFLLLTFTISATYADPDSSDYVLKVGYIRDANSFKMYSGKIYELAGVEIPNLYGKRSGWTESDEEIFYEYGTLAKDFVRNLLLQTEEKTKWFGFRKELRKSRYSRMIAVELDPINSEKKHMRHKKSEETLAYIFVMLPDDGSGSDDVLHYANLPDKKYKLRKPFFLNEELLKQGFGFADSTYSSTYFRRLKKAQEYAVKNSTPGKTEYFSGINRRPDKEEFNYHTPSKVSEILDGMYLKLEMGYRVRLMGILMPSYADKNANKRFTHPYGNALAVARQDAHDFLTDELSGKDQHEIKDVYIYQDAPGKLSEHPDLFAWVFIKQQNNEKSGSDAVKNHVEIPSHLLPKWTSTSDQNVRCLNFSIVMNGWAYPWNASTSKFSNLISEMHQMAKRENLGLMGERFKSINFIPKEKGKKQVLKGIGTPRRRNGYDNQSWKGKSNFNG